MEKHLKKILLIIYSFILYFLTYILKETLVIFVGVEIDNTINIITNILLIMLPILYIIANIKKEEKEIKENTTKLFIGILSILTYFIISMSKVVILQIFKINPETMSEISKSIYQIAFEILIISILILLNRKTIIKNIKDIKKNHKKYFKKYFKYWFLILGIMMLSNLIIININNGNIAGNEEAVRTTLEQEPIYIYLSAVVFAPFIEEITFRRSIKNIINDKYLFIITSGLIFGLLHVITNITTWTDFLYIIPYSAPGIIFAYLLEKTDNIFVPIGIHLIHNGLLTSLQILLIILRVL